MIDHASIKVSDFDKSKAFYSKLLAPLGYKLENDFAEYKAAGFAEGSKADFWIGGSDSVEDENHVAFTAKDKAAVDGFYKAGIEAGGTDNGKPGYRKEYSPGYYAAFIKDLDGHNIEAVFHDPKQSE